MKISLICIKNKKIYLLFQFELVSKFGKIISIFELLPKKL